MEGSHKEYVVNMDGCALGVPDRVVPRVYKAVVDICYMNIFNNEYQTESLCLCGLLMMTRAKDAFGDAEQRTV
jgi:hypothetical protein